MPYKLPYEHSAVFNRKYEVRRTRSHGMVVCMQADATPSNSTGGNALPANDQMAYKIPHAAQVLDLGERTVWALVHSGEIESIKIGASRRIPRAALVAYIERMRAAA
jgi:excisionase family DNA binding protein